MKLYSVPAALRLRKPVLPADPIAVMSHEDVTEQDLTHGTMLAEVAVN